MLTALLLLTVPMQAVEPEPSTITVTASGTAERSCQRLILSTTISADGKLAGDAIAKQEDFRSHFTDAVEELAIPGLQVRSLGRQISSGSSVSSQQRQMMQMNGQTVPEAGIRVAESLVVEFTAPESDEEALQTVRRLLDAAAELDVTFESSPNEGFVRPLVTDRESLQTEAVADAMKNARIAADRIAKQADRKVTRVHSVRQTQTSQRSQSRRSVGEMTPFELFSQMSSLEDGGSSEGGSVDRGMTLHRETASLTVTFELAD